MITEQLMSIFIFSTLHTNLPLAMFGCTKMQILNLQQFDMTCLTQGTVNDASTLFSNISVEFVKLCIPRKTVLVHTMINLGMIRRFAEIYG